MKQSLKESRQSAERLKSFMDFLGFGDPQRCFPDRSGPLWFIGIEEAKATKSEQEADHFVSKLGQRKWTDSEAKPNEKVYAIMAKLAVGLMPANSDLRQRGWEYYRTNKLFSTPGIFQTNLFPLGKGRANEPLPAHYKKIFGLSNWNQYQRMCKSDRWPEIESVRSKNNPWVTICFGKSSWKEFKECLKLDQGETVGPFEVHAAQRVVLTPFFSSRPNCMPDKRIKELAEVISRRFE